MDIISRICLIIAPTLLCCSVTLKQTVWIQIVSAFKKSKTNIQIAVI